MRDYTDITPEIVNRYNRQGPRYTSYPTVPVWDSGTFGDRFAHYLQREGQRQQPLSLYIHLPFCSRLCTFCGCNQFITTNNSLVERYLDCLEQEMQAIAAKLQSRKQVKQLHLGGGTPTHLSVSQLQRLMQSVQRHFDLDYSGEIALEAHPRVTTNQQLSALRELGFNRVSFGVQDLDSQVQRAINRDQTLEQTERTFYQSRELGYNSINIDLVYGLPMQTVETFSRTMQRVHEMGPDRLAIYSFAYIPNMFKGHERAIKELDLPHPSDKVAIYVESIKYLVSHGYHMIGMDHYALPQDELTLAQQNHTLHRNFMGYTVLKGLTQIGVGVSAISDFGDGYFQKVKDLHEYMNRIQAGEFPLFRSMELSADDLLRRDVIETLMCQCQLSVPEFEKRHGIEFRTYFLEQWVALEGFEQEGLVRLTDQSIELTRLGVLFMRNVVMPFDAYLQDKDRVFNFSKTV